MDENRNHQSEMLEALILHDRMETTASYLARGRTLQGLTDEQLKSGWTAVFKAWFRTRSDVDRVPLDNHEGELALRKIETPNENIANEMEEARAEISRDGLSNPGVRDAIRRFMEARENGH